MLVRVTFVGKGDFNNTSSWLNYASNHSQGDAIDQIGKEGVSSLSSNTPRDTGETASGWDYEVNTSKSVSEISWVNRAHPDLQVNVAKLIELGHGTGTGGYIPPRPYIKRSMDGIFKTAGDKVTKELIK